MKNNENQLIIKLAKYCFKYSLVIGTLLFISYCFTRIETIAFIGFFYICLAVAVNLFVLLVLLITLIPTSRNRIEIFQSIGLLLVNVPVALFYFWMLVEFPSIFN